MLRPSAELQGRRRRQGEWWWADGEQEFAVADSAGLGVVAEQRMAGPGEKQERVSCYD